MNVPDPAKEHMDNLPRKPDGTVSIRRRVFSLRTLLAFGIAAVFIFLLVTRFDLDWSATWQNVREMNPWLYLLAFVLYYASFIFRGARWRLLAQNAGLHDSPDERLPSAIMSASLIIIGWFVNSITGLRMGDAYRAYAFAEESKRSFSWSLGTMLAERVIDTATIFFVLVLSVLLLASVADSTTSTNIVIAASIIAFVLLALTLIMKFYGVRLARFLPSRFETSYNRFQEGTLGSFKQLPLLFALGLAGWLMEIARLYFVVEALGLTVSLPLVTIVALGHAILSFVPTPGGLGVVEPGLIGLLSLSLERHDAVSITLVDRSITYFSVIVVGGLIFLLRQVINSRRRRRQESLAHLAEDRRNTVDA
ncbi:MAG: flippase-like domain-containing protein [Chloroflexi bacterium]|nr:flippase-like domain-containing protein [Chloroflexota bacterium]